ncbi:MAG: protein phosphatase 2C domain-containing protein [Actinomycetota bacterium]
MTTNRRWKRRVRARAARTGESYTAALRALRQLEVLRMRGFKITPAAATDTGAVRAVNEDSVLAEGDLLVVADGMGGQRGGDVASRVAVDALRQAFAASATPEGLIDGVRAANDAVRAIDDERPGATDRPIGTTIAAVGVVGPGDSSTVAEPEAPMLVAVNVGDSRVYLLRDRQLTRISTDHSMVADLVRAGALSEDEAAIHPERHILTRAIGVAETVEPDVAEVRSRPGDRLLVCSDGLFNELAPEQIRSVLADTTEPDRAATTLVERAVEAGGRDNVTVVVADIAPAGA